MQAALQSTGVRWVAAGWIFFIAENLILSENRETILRNYGTDTYHGVYNVLSTVSCGTIAASYWKYRQSDPIKNVVRRGFPMHLTGFIVQALGVAILSQLAPKLQVPVTLAASTESAPSASSATSSATSSPSAAPSSIAVRCPMDFTSTNKSTSSDGLFGVERISRHATFWAFGFVLMGQTFTSIYLPVIAFGLCPSIFALIGGAHQDSRFRRQMGGYLSPERDARTSHIPFMALLQGRAGSWQNFADEIKWTNATVAVALVGLASLRRFKR
jgi:uncharacterized membrane protein